MRSPQPMLRCPGHDHRPGLLCHRRRGGWCRGRGVPEESNPRPVPAHKGVRVDDDDRSPPATDTGCAQHAEESIQTPERGAGGLPGEHDELLAHERIVRTQLRVPSGTVGDAITDEGGTSRSCPGKDELVEQVPPGLDDALETVRETRPHRWQILGARGGHARGDESP